MTSAEAETARRRPDFSRRSDAAEWLDAPRHDPGELAAVLRDLARFNAAMLGHRPILHWLKRAIAAAPRGRPIRLIDVGCGYGDLLRAVRRWAERRRIAISLSGIDRDLQTIAIARAATDPRDAIDFAVADVFRFCPAEPVDLIVNSLLAHHLSDEAIAELLRWMEATARRGWLVSDLQRHRLPYRFIGLAGRVAHLHPVVVADGRISVTRSLTRAEWEADIAAAGLPRDRVTIRWYLFRHLIGRLR